MKLTINKKDYKLVWGLPALSQFCENVNHVNDLEAAFNLAFPTELGEVKPLEMHKARLELIYAAIQVGCELDRVENGLTMVELQHFIDNAAQEIVDEIFKDFLKSKYLGQSIEEYLYESVEEVNTAPKKKSRRAS